MQIGINVYQFTYIILRTERKGLINMTGTITKDYGYFKKGDKVEFVEYDFMGAMSNFYKVRNTTQNFVEWIEKRYIMWD